MRDFDGFVSDSYLLRHSFVHTTTARQVLIFRKNTSPSSMRLGIYSGETNNLRSYTLVSCDQSVDGFHFHPVSADVGKERSFQRKCSTNSIGEFKKNRDGYRDNLLRLRIHHIGHHRGMIQRLYRGVFGFPSHGCRKLCPRSRR